MDGELDASKVRYIKLGAGNRNAKHCITNGTMVLGFWTYQKEMFEACVKKDWPIVETLLRENRRQERNGVEPKSVADDLRQVKEFFDDDPDTIWITFNDRKLYCGVGGGVDYAIIDLPEGQRCQKSMSRPWSDTDLAGNRLRIDDLAGHISMVSQYRGTICEVADFEYVLRRVNGLRSEVYVKTSQTLEVLYRDVEAIIKNLTPKDFELLVEMIFVNTGWKRVGFAGRTEQAIDLLLARPSLESDGDEIVAVQIKSKTNQREYERYESALGQTYQSAFFVYHTGEIARVQDGIMQLMDAQKLAPLTVNTGLLGWLLERVK